MYPARRILGCALAALAVSAAPASADLLDTLTVDPAASSATVGKVALKPGTRYVLEVTGTMKSVNTQGGYGFSYDALYCYASHNFQTPDCVRGGPSDHDRRNFNFFIGAGSDNRWGMVDSFRRNGKPYSTDPADFVDYDPNHSYTVDFYSPADAPLRAGGYYTVNGPCPTCTNSTTGSFTIKVFGPATATAPPPAPTQPSQPAAQLKQPCTLATTPVMALASQTQGTGCKPAKLGATNVVAAPKPNRPVDTSVTIPPDVKQIFLDAGIVDAETQQLIASLVVRHKARKVKDQFDGCILMMGGNPDVFLFTDGYGQRMNKDAALRLACARLVADEAAGARASSHVARISASGCNAYFVPAFRKGKATKRRARSAVQAARKNLVAACAQEDSAKLSMTLRSKRKPLRSVVGSALQSALVRRAPATARDGANAALAFKWSRR